MTPANLALRIDQGATFRALLRLMQPNPVYKPITGIAATGPVRLTVEHGLPGDWPVWVEHVRQLPEANRAPLRQLPHMAQVVTATELDLPGINATGTRPEGGQLVYRPPLDLTDATAELRLYEDGSEVGTLPVTVSAGGWVDVVLSAAETADLAWRSREYVLDVTLPNGDVLRAYTGTITVEVAGAAAGQVCHGFATAGGDRGQPGPRGAQVVGSTFDDEGRLIMTLDDGSTVDGGINGAFVDLGNETDPEKGASTVARSQVTVTSVDELAALPTGKLLSAQLDSSPLPRRFVFDSSDLREEVSADTTKGAYVAPLSDLTGENGAWSVDVSGGVFLDWWPATDQGAQECINYCVANGVAVVRFVASRSITTVLTNRQEVTFVGPGSITGPGAYGLRVLTEESPQAAPSFGFVASTALPNFSRRPLRVVLTGDSLTTPSPNTIDTKDSFWGYLQKKIQQDNPGVAIEFYNRGIGGRVFSELNGTPVSGFPDWYTDTGEAWLNYIEDLEPDLVVIGMGMNGGANTNNIASIAGIYTKIKAFAHRCDALFVTTPVPTTQADPIYYSQFSTKSEQENRNRAAGAVRSAGRYYGFPILDVNRQCNIARGGFDVADSYMQGVESPALTSGAYTFPAEVHEAFSMQVVVPNRAAYSPLGKMAIKLDAGAAFAFLEVDSSLTPNTLRINLYGRTGSPYLQSRVTGQIIPDAPHTLNILVQGSTIRVYIEGTETDDVPEPVKFLGEGGLFTPAIGSYTGSFASGPLTSIQSASIGVSKRYKPTITNEEMWGVSTASTGTKAPFGGNGLNHPTSMGASKLYREVLDMCSFGINELRSQFVESVVNSGSATLTMTPTLRAGYSQINQNAKSIFVYARAYESTSAVYSEAWYRLINHGNNKWYLSEPIGLLETSSGVVTHTLSVDVNTGELTLTNTRSPESTARNVLGTAYEINLMA